jgi:hypothetical protein
MKKGQIGQQVEGEVYFASVILILNAVYQLKKW